MKMPNFNVKDLMREAGSSISSQVSRVVQVLFIIASMLANLSNFLFELILVLIVWVICLFFQIFKLTEEKLNLTSDKTEFDSNFENLIERGENTKVLTEKLVHRCEALLVPNPGKHWSNGFWTARATSRGCKLAALPKNINNKLNYASAFCRKSSGRLHIWKDWEEKTSTIVKHWVAEIFFCFK